jgi:N-formylmaleamate deformylase
MPHYIEGFVTDGFVRANNIKIHYYRTGGGKPVVVLNHGAGDDGLCFTRVAKQLEADYDLVLPDARGHGRSSSGRGDYSTSAHVEDLAGLIQTLQLGRVALGGHSMGADTAMSLAATHPELVRGVFLEDPPIILPGEKFNLPPEQGGQSIQGDEIGKMMARSMRLIKLLPAFIGERMARRTSPTYPDDEIKPWVASKKRLSFDFLNALASTEMLPADPLEMMRKIIVPVVLVIGDREKMSIVSQETAAEVARQNNLVKVVHLAGASHDIRRTRFNGYMGALKEFLEDMYPRAGRS